LRSVRGQSLTDLDILVVDDGSYDATRDLVLAHAAVDPRVRLLAQANQGTARARDNGWQATQARTVAFLDADDVWVAAKLERQLAALAGHDRAGLVYSCYQRIDEAGLPLPTTPQTPKDGWVLEDIIAENFIGNGSSALVRRDVLEATGGFAGADHGCADWQFYCRAAAVAEFAAVASADVGYRRTTTGQSASFVAMFVAALAMRDELLARHPALRELIDASMLRFAEWLMAEACHAGHYAATMRISTLAAEAIPDAPRRPRTQAAIVATRALTARIAGFSRRLHHAPASVTGGFVSATMDRP
jgi:glycosyltransferase involved in cell wall biosynthesis